MGIKWDALGLVAVASFGIAVLVVVLAAFAMVGLSARKTTTDVTTFEGGQRTTLGPAVGTGVAGVCIAAIVAIVLYGLWIIVS
jgi:hypothetical protein